MSKKKKRKNKHKTFNTKIKQKHVSSHDINQIANKVFGSTYYTSV